MHLTDLFESRSAPLYHFMDMPKTMHMVEFDRLDARWKHEIDGRVVAGNSFTRNPKLNWSTTMIRMTVDQDALSRRHKIIPLDGEKAFRQLRGFPHADVSDRMDNGKHVLAEEFVVGPIMHVHVYIREIYFGMNSSGYLNPDQTRSLYAALRSYCDRFSIPLRLHHFVQTELEDDRQAA